MSNKDQMQTAKGRLGLYAGFWLALCSKLEWVPSERFPVAATDSKRVFYNLEQINSRPLGEVVYIALHEVGHNMLAHMTRMGGGRDPDLQGIAMDYALNELLDKVAAETPVLGMICPEDACRDPDPANVGLTWEARYEKLKKQQGKGGKPGFDDHLAPTNDDGTPMSEADQDALRKEWTLAVQSAAVMAKRMGKLPGFMEEFITDLIKPKVDWRTQLAHCMARVTHDESSYRRFNRRHLHRGYYLPGQYNEQIGPIAYFCDTSGSISSNEFKAALGAMSELLEDLKPEIIHFGQCDTKLHSVQELTPDDLPLPGLKVFGRGGTDMREAFEWACAHEHEIEAFILQTDLFIPPLDPSLIPNVPVIWIVTTDAAVPAGCDFGSLVRVVL
jgi:predicted metal-dependent peptidase